MDWVTDDGTSIPDQPDLAAATREARRVLGPDVAFGISALDSSPTRPLVLVSPDGTSWQLAITDNGDVAVGPMP